MRRLAGLLAFAGSLLSAANDPRWPVLSQVPEKARAKTNPMSKNADAPVAGRKLFEQHCTTCHGKAGEGSAKAPPLSNDELRHATPGDIYWILTNGVIRQGMPSWSQLPPPQRWQIVSFIAAMNTH
jgi:mono/diheme cytochrome c family protein